MIVGDVGTVADVERACSSSWSPWGWVELPGFRLAFQRVGRPELSSLPVFFDDRFDQ